MVKSQQKSQRGMFRKGWLALPLVAVLAVMTPALLLGWGHQGTQQVEANDSTVDFAISGPTTVSVNDTFTATVSLVSAGGVSGSVSHWQAAISWTTGLTGPGEGAGKALSINNCPSSGATAAPFTPLGPAQTAAAICMAFPAPFSVAEETAITASFNLTCGATPSTETVTMRVTAGAKQNGTHIVDSGGNAHAELTGSETLDVQCLDFDADDDGCTDEAELGPIASKGGMRDPDYYWDFMDMWINKQKNRRVNVLDIGAIVQRLFTAGDPGGDPLDPPQALTGYHVSADRSAPIGPNLWNAGPADGNINIIEIGLTVVQFGHDCSESD